MTDFCERCRRPAPPEDDDEFCEWEAVSQDGAFVGVICPGCTTGAEQQSMDEQMFEDLDAVQATDD